VSDVARFTAALILLAALPACGDGASGSHEASSASGAGGTPGASSSGSGGSGGEEPFDCSGGFVPITGGAPATISACQTISAPGAYTLDADLTGDSTGCLHIENTSDVLLDCGGHAVTAPSTPLEIAGVQGFELVNCTLKIDVVMPLVKIDDSANGGIHGCAFEGAYLDVHGSQGLRIYENDMRSNYQQTDTSGSVIACNTMTNTRVAPDLTAAVVISNFGAHNVIRKNTIDGAWDLMPDQFASDDGIVLTDEHDDEVRDNTIDNNWDCGIETVGTIRDTTFAGNRIKNAALCGVGAWYWSNLSNVTIQDNTVDGAMYLFMFYRIYGVRPGDTGVLFENNRFLANRFQNPTSVGLPASTIPIYANMGFNGNAGPGSTVPAADQYHLTNNVFSNNDFGPNPAPDFGGEAVPGLVVDGGGNHCGAHSAVTYPLDCKP
jgi:parallel beta-helix repeat protein